MPEFYLEQKPAFLKICLFEIQPDLLTMAKGLTSGYVPLSAVVAKGAPLEHCVDRIASRHRVVEVVRGQLTTDDVYDRAVEFARLLGKVPIKVFEMPGFVATRVVLPLVNEAMHVVMEGVAEAAEVLAGEKAETSRDTHGAGRAFVVTRADCLGGVLDDRETVPMIFLAAMAAKSAGPTGTLIARDSSRIRFRSIRLEGKRLVKLEQRLDGREYLCADRFTVADICCGYALILCDLEGAPRFVS